MEETLEKETNIAKEPISKPNQENTQSPPPLKPPVVEKSIEKFSPEEDWTVDGLLLGHQSVVGEPVGCSQWNSSIFACLGRNDEFCSSDLEVCFLGSLAPCELYGGNAERLGSSPGAFVNHCLPYTGLYLLVGRQFEPIEQLVYEMIENKLELDNVTYSTIITSAKRSGLSDKAVEWFERMYKIVMMPDEVTYSAVLDVYAKLGKVEEVLSLYERGRASGWKPDAVAFSVLGKMFREDGDYDGIQYILQEMKAVGVEPNLIVYNILWEAMSKAGKPSLAWSLFEDMMNAGVTPSDKTLTVLIKIYGKARWSHASSHISAGNHRFPT